MKNFVSDLKLFGITQAIRQASQKKYWINQLLTAWWDPIQMAYCETEEKNYATECIEEFFDRFAN